MQQVQTETPPVSFTRRISALFQILYDTVMSSIVHQHIPNEENIKKTDENRQENWEKIDSDTGNPLENHLKAYGYISENGEVLINDYSIYVAMHRDLKMSQQEAADGARIGISVPKLNDIDTAKFHLFHGISGHFSPKDAVKLMHPHDTGFYEKGTGKFNKERFDTLKKYAILDEHNNYIISPNQFQNCMNFLAEKDSRWEDADIIYNTLGKIGHEGEFTQLFSLMKPLIANTIDNVPYYALADIEEFYLNTPKTMKRIRNTPVPISEDKESEPSSHFFDKCLAKASSFAKEVVDDCPTYFNNNHQRTAGNQRFFSLPQNQCPLMNNSTSMIGSSISSLMIK